MTPSPDAVSAAVRTEGVAAVDGVLDHAVVAAASAALDDILAGEIDIADDRGWRTPSHQVAYALPLKHPVFLDLCTHPGLSAIAGAVLGPDCVIAAFNGIDLVPRGVGQEPHRDHPHLTPGTTLYLHLVCALDPFTTASGATRVVPRSHDGHPEHLDPVAAWDAATVMEVGAGGVVAFDGALVHAAGPNSTEGHRRALHVFYARPWVRPHWDFAASFGPDGVSALDERQRRVLGIDLRPRRFELDARRVVR